MDQTHLTTYLETRKASPLHWRSPDETTYERTREHDLKLVRDTITDLWLSQRLCGRYNRTIPPPTDQRTCDSTFFRKALA